MYFWYLIPWGIYEIIFYPDTTFDSYIAYIWDNKFSTPKLSPFIDQIIKNGLSRLTNFCNHICIYAKAHIYGYFSTCMEIIWYVRLLSLRLSMEIKIF